MKDDAKQLLDLEADGALEPAGREALGRLAGAELEAERHQLHALHQMLAAGRVKARPGFARQVVSALPTAPWEARGLRAWRVPAAVMVALGAVAGFLMGLDAGGGETVSLIAALGAVADFAVAALLSGAGLLSASWRGVGLALGEALGPLQLLLFGVGVVALNLLLLRLLRRRRPAPAPARSPRR